MHFPSGKRNTITYFGITNNPKRRAGEHRAKGKRGIMRVEGTKVSRKTALAREGARITNYRKRNGRKSLQNK